MLTISSFNSIQYVAPKNWCKRVKIARVSGQMTSTDLCQINCQAGVTRGSKSFLVERLFFVFPIDESDERGGEILFELITKSAISQRWKTRYKFTVHTSVVRCLHLEIVVFALAISQSLFASLDGAVRISFASAVCENLGFFANNWRAPTLANWAWFVSLSLNHRVSFVAFAIFSKFHVICYVKQLKFNLLFSFWVVRHLNVCVCFYTTVRVCNPLC